MAWPGGPIVNGKYLHVLADRRNSVPSWILRIRSSASRSPGPQEMKPGCALTSEQPIVVGIADQRVNTLAAGKRVVTSAPEKHLEVRGGSAQAVQIVAAERAVESVRVPVSAEDVGPEPAKDILDDSQ